MSDAAHSVTESMMPLVARIQALEREVRALQEQLAAARTHGDELQEFLDRAAEALHMVGPDGKILWANAAELEMLGYAADEYIGHPVSEFHVDQDLAEDFLARLLRGECLRDRPARMRRRDGIVRHVLVSSNGLFRDGKFVSTRCMTRDVTIERQAEEAQGRLAAIVASSDDAIISKNLDGIITSWNLAAERMYGYKAEEMIGESVLKIIPPELRSEEDTILSRIRAGKRIEHYETVRLAKGGRRVEVSISVSPVLDRSGTIIGASKIARDISSRLEAERKKDQFLAILAHELRNPLAPVRNAIAIFGQSGLTDEQRQRAQRIAERQTEHMTRLLDDLLDVSRISNGRVELKKRRVELRSLLHQSVDAVRSHLQAKEHTLRVHLADEDLWLDADPVRIQQIVTNLLNNAAKYTDPGGTIDLVSERDGAMAVIRVRDNGIGFDAEMEPRLFTLFSQAEGVGHRAAGGLGIGLALVREFAERHGGSVEAASDGPLLGSEFVVRLPCTVGGAIGGVPSRREG